MPTTFWSIALARRRVTKRQTAHVIIAGHGCALARREGDPHLFWPPGCVTITPHAGLHLKNGEKVEIKHTKTQKGPDLIGPTPFQNFGAPGAIRTHGLSLRRRSLYPTELREPLNI